MHGSKPYRALRSAKQGGLRQALPTREPDVNTLEFQARQQRGAILNVQVKGGRLRIDLAVKQIENLVETGLRKLEQAQMPPQVAPKEVVVIKKSRCIAEQFDALFGTTLHLKHMGQAMQGPKILRLQSQRLARAALGHYVVANLFHREGMGRKKVRVTRRLRSPMVGDSRLD